MYYLFEKFFRDRISVKQTGYYISNIANYQRFLSQKPSQWPKESICLNEWDILNAAKEEKLEIKDDEIEEIEDILADPTLWNVIVCDRRIFYGPKSVFTQDYKPRYTHDEMKKIVVVAYRKIKEHIEKVKPDFIISFLCVTFGEYLYYLFAKRRGIKYFNIHDTKIGNYFTATNHVYRPESEIKECYEKYKYSDFSDDIQEEVENYMKKFSHGRVTYDGQDYVHEKKKLKPFSFGSLARVGKSFVNKKITQFKNPQILQDNQPDPFLVSLYNDFIKPLRFYKAFNKIKHHFISFDQMDNMKFAFYPLHLEPEMSVLVWGRPYLNQIELIRMIAISLPFNWKLVVKDHPKNPFYRKSNFYKKLLEIPNVLFVEHDMPTNEIIKRSQMVITLCGFVGFEALCLKKPAIALAGCIYEYMPKSMFRKVDDMRELAEEIKDLLDHYKFDEEAIKKFAASVIKESFSFEWYSLGKKIRNYFESSIDDFPEKKGEEKQFRNFVDFILKRLN